MQTDNHFDALDAIAQKRNEGAAPEAAPAEA